jgi:hypothetical protein
VVAVKVHAELFAAAFSKRAIMEAGEGGKDGLLGGYGFQGVTLGVDGSCKDGKKGPGCCKFREKGAGKCARVGREEEGTSSNRPELGGVVLALQSAALSEDVLLL